MALFGTLSFGSLFGSTNQSSFRTQIIGLDYSLISASVDAKLTQKALASLSAEDRAAYNFRGTDDGIIPPWQQVEESKSLNQKIRQVRELDKFIDLKDPSLKSLSNDPDKQATFALYKALTNLRVLAEYAAEDKTSTSSLGRLDDTFQSGLTEIREYLESANLSKLDLFLGDKRYKTESSVRTGKNVTGYDGGLVSASKTEALAGLTGTEVFTISITKSGVTDDIAVDLSGVTGTLSLENIKDHINSQIEALTIDDGQGNQVPKHQTRFDIHRDTTTGKYGLQVDGTITEEVGFSAAASDPTLYVASSVAQLDDDFAITSRLTEINGLDGTLTVDDTTSFAGVDIDASAIKALVDKANDKDDDLDPKIASLRDKFRADALAATSNDDSTSNSDEDPDASSITNIDADNKVNADTTAKRVAVDSEGGIYVVGNSAGSFGQQVNTATDQDVFLTKFDNEGNVVFSRLLGVSGSATAYAVTVDGNDNVIVAGQTDSALSTGDVIDTKDAFVTKISKRGDEVFRYQLDTFGETAALSVAVDSNNDIFVGGYTKSGISATSGFSGGQDALILKLDGASGSLVDSNVFGTSGNEVIKGLAVDSNDNLVVAAESAGNAVVYRIDGTDLTNQTDSIDFGSLGSGGSIQGISIDTVNKDVYIAGVTTNASLDAGGTASVNGTAAGGFEGFVSALSLTGQSNLKAEYTTYLSTSGTDRIGDIVVVDQVVYVAGTTAGTLGESKRGSTDAFVARVDGKTGAIEDIEQFGESLAKQAAGGLAFTTKGNSVLSKLGLPQGTVQIDQTLDVETQTSATAGDYFYFTIDGGTRKKITLEDGDTLNDIARKIKVAAVGKIKVEVSSTSEGDKLKLEAVEGGKVIDLIPGKNDQDLLAHLGIEPGKLLPKDEVLGLGDASKDRSKEENLGGAFGLKLDGALNIEDKATAKYVLGLLDTAISTVQRAYRSLEYNPLIDQLKNGKNTSGPVPAHISKQLANFQTGLARLQTGSLSPTVSFFA